MTSTISDEQVRMVLGAIFPGAAFNSEQMEYGRAALACYEATRVPDPRMVELIAADKEFDAARHDLDVVSAYGNYPKIYASRHDRFVAAQDRRAAALAAMENGK